MVSLPQGLSCVECGPGLLGDWVKRFGQLGRQLAGLHCCCSELATSPLAGVGTGRQGPGLLASVGKLVIFDMDGVHCTRCSMEVTSLTPASGESRGVLPMLKPGDSMAMVRNVDYESGSIVGKSDLGVQRLDLECLGSQEA